MHSFRAATWNLDGYRGDAASRLTRQIQTLESLNPDVLVLTEVKDTTRLEGTFIQMRLTLRGLTILGSTPDSLEGRVPLIDRIKTALAGGAKEAGSEAVKQLAQQAFAAAMAAAPAIVSSIGAR